MFDLPLHPIVVHFPIALSLLIPIACIALYFSIKKGFATPRAWVIVVLLSALYLGSSLVAVEMGERDEDKVEKVVGHDTLEEHEEIGEKIPWVAGALLIASLLPLFTKNSTSFQIINIIVALLAILPIVKAGHTGGELVYKHGAARAHTGMLLPKADQSQGKYLSKESEEDEGSEDSDESKEKTDNDD